ncbi:MAG: DUF1513 domain-containing protein [Marivibrio sp.]|uniref:DUF1513 domain-containing protein n=1 Tax=Marivibrio sp. TaxID=2039719 RepID=UPI0032EF699D
MRSTGIDRRALLRGLAGAGLGLSLGAPAFAAPGDGRAPGLVIGCARGADGRDRAVILDGAGRLTLDHILPGRGHGPALSADGRLAAVPARRPGRFIALFDLGAPRFLGLLESPPDRHFQGHAVFTADARTLVATENDFEAGRGVLGLWDVAGRRRIAERDCDGAGPHQLLLDPGGGSVTVANGGILTHPDHGRAKLNLATMRPNLRRIRLSDGRVLAGAALDPTLHKVSLRHMDAAPDGTVIVGGQDEGRPGGDAPLAAVWPAGGGALSVAPLGPADTRRLKRYVGSVAVDRRGRFAALASPRGGVVVGLDLARGTAVGAVAAADICGLARDETRDGGFFASSGTGRLYALDVDATGPRLRNLAAPRAESAMWDNHLAAGPRV